MQKYKIDFLDDKITEGTWTSELQKRKSFYLFFIVHWIKHVRGVAKNKLSSVIWFFFSFILFLLLFI